MVYEAQTLTTAKKTGFKNLDLKTPVIIRDFRGKLFYDTSDLSKQPEMFNLPEGNFTVVSGNVKPLKEPVAFNLSVLPRAERNYPNPLKFKIEFGYNVNKCSIIWNKKTILFDEGLKDALLPELFLILFHEYGHSLYKTEKYADLFAANMMIKKGYNNSQIGKAHLNILSSKQEIRKKFIVNHLIKRSIR